MNELNKGWSKGSLYSIICWIETVEEVYIEMGRTTQVKQFPRGILC